MRVAFYAPLKPPTSGVPSGDRLIARTLMRSLESAGHEVRLASHMRSLDRDGNRDRQIRLGRVGEGLARRLVRGWAARSERPDVWVTYHLYHKAADWIGPAAAQSLGIPYVAIEAAYAPRQATGPWATGLAQVARCIKAAELVIGLNPADGECVRPMLRPSARYIDHPPFIDGTQLRAAEQNRTAIRDRLAAATGLDRRLPWIIAVGMMRDGNKLACYEALAAALASVSTLPWQLIIAGDGPARGKVEAALRPVADRTRFLGALDGNDLAGAYAAADLFVWPAIREPIGMVFIEAQAAGLPVIGAERPGPASIVRHGETGLLCKEGEAGTLADAIATLLKDTSRRRAMGKAASSYAFEHHDIATCGPRLAAAIEGLLR